MTQDAFSLLANQAITQNVLTQEGLANYAEELDSTISAERLRAALEQAGLLETGGATAGGRPLAKRITSSMRWKNERTREAWDLYLKMLRRDLWLSSLSSIVYISLIVLLTSLLVVIAYQILTRHFSYQQLAGLPLPLVIRLLFRANVHERDHHLKMRADLNKGLNVLAKG